MEHDKLLNTWFEFGIQYQILNTQRSGSALRETRSGGENWWGETARAFGADCDCQIEESKSSGACVSSVAALTNVCWCESSSFTTLSSSLQQSLPCMPQRS